MKWRLEYYDGGLPLIEVKDVPWNELDLSTVQRVYISLGEYTMIMQGLDFYWVDEENQEFGSFVSPDNYDIYEGKFHTSFAIVDGAFVDTGGKMPGDEINSLGSCYMPENEAKEVGIL